MPKVDAFAEDSSFRDISLPSFSDSSYDCTNDWMHHQANVSQAAASHHQPSSVPPQSSPAKSKRRSPGETAENAAASDASSHLVRVPPGFEKRASDDDAAAFASGPSEILGLPQRQPEFMATAIQVIPLSVGKFVGDNQRDMQEMVRVLRGASDCIDPSYVYVTDPFVRQFVWESLGSCVMSRFPDMQFMRQQLFVHLNHVQLRLAASQANAGEHSPPDDRRSTIDARAPEANCEHRKPDARPAPTASSTSTLGIDRTSMNKCRMIDPYLALIQMAIYSEPQPQPPNHYKAAEEFALYGNLYTEPTDGNERKSPPLCEAVEAPASASTALVLRTAPGNASAAYSSYDYAMKSQQNAAASAALQQHPNGAPFCLNYAGYQQQQQHNNNPQSLQQQPTMQQQHAFQRTYFGMQHAPHSYAQQHSVQQQQHRSDLYAVAAAAASHMQQQQQMHHQQQQQQQQHSMDYATFVPMHKSSPLRRCSALANVPESAAFASSYGPTANGLLLSNGQQSAQQQQQAAMQQQHAATASRANLYQQFRLAKRWTQQKVQQMQQQQQQMLLHHFERVAAGEAAETPAPAEYDESVESASSGNNPAAS